MPIKKIDFGCIGGGECTGLVKRGDEGCMCPMQIVDYRIEVIVKDRVVDVKTGQIPFAKNAGSAELKFTTTARPDKLAVEMSVNGELIGKETVIPRAG